ncbi:MAG: hypothetical protein WCI67_21615 [Chloroflexales bacterium]
MRPRRRQKPVAIGNVTISVVLLQVSGAYAVWCHASHEVAWSMTPAGVRRQALRVHGAEIAAALAAAGWEPRIVTLTVGGDARRARQHMEARPPRRRRRPDTRRPGGLGQARRRCSPARRGQAPAGGR